MPCRWSRRCRAAATPAEHGLPSPTSAPDVEDWKKIRKYNLRMMRKQVRLVVLLMALMEALRVGPVQMVYAGKHGYPAPDVNDFGIAYSVGYFVSWLYVCLFMVIWMPLFDWWVPKTTVDPDTPSTTMKVVSALKRLNMILLPLSIAVSLVTYVYYTLHTLVYVDSRPVGSSRFPKNTRKNWLTRLFLVIGVAISTSLGFGAFQILADLDLARVKPIEYALIVVPVQVNIGIFLGSLMQFKREKVVARRQAREIQAAKEQEIATLDEKASLLLDA